jgi:glycosyltransferase involved in cell wall biosynthesis
LKARLKVAIVHPRLGFGGSESPALWTIEALKGDYDVTLISTGEADVDRLNSYYGTSLAPGDFSHRSVQLPAGLRSTGKFAGLKGRFLLRYVRRAAPEFDFLISAYGPMDFGKPGIQMIADFSFVEEWRLELNPSFRKWKGWFYGKTFVRDVYLGVCDAVARVHSDAWKQNLTLANSHWSAARLLEKYGIASQVVYPPVAIDFPAVPFSARDCGFVCLGRVSPEKCVHSVIAILQKVRERGHDVHLHILGGMDDSEYGRKVRSLAGRSGEWVHLEGWVQGEHKMNLLTGHRFGIHARPNEPFGIAVAEMVQAGCLVFVPNEGGQVEIVNQPELTFSDEAEAVEKIHAVLSDQAKQAELLDGFRKGWNAFSVRTFVETMRNVVGEFVERHIPSQAGRKA